MYFLWFFAAAGIGLLWMLLKRQMSSRRKARALSPFQQSRPVPELSGAAESQAQAKTQDAFLKIAEKNVAAAGQMPALAGSAEQSTAHPRTATMGTESSTGVPGVAVAGQASMSMPRSRVSTWDNRRLFSEFRGILNGTDNALPLPNPEDLPIQDDDLIFGSVTPAIAQLLPETAARRHVQRKNLTGAGYHSRASWLNLTAIRFTLAFLALVIIGFWLIMAPPALEPWLLALLVMAPIFLWALPPLAVAVKAGERKTDIERGLPDVLDMLNMGVSQGLTVAQSLKRISRELMEAHPALAQELRIVNQQAEVGSMPQALRNFSQRIESQEVSSFTSLLVQSEATGTSISKALTDYSDSIRASLKERADERANAASFKLLFPVALLLMPSVFLVLLGPAIVQMSDFFSQQGGQLQQNREDAIRTLDQRPQARAAAQDAGAP